MRLSTTSQRRVWRWGKKKHSSQRMERMVGALSASVAGSPNAPKLLAGTGQDKVHLLIAVTADRGLAGAFNTNIGRATRLLCRKLESEGKTVKILTVGRKGRDYLRRELNSRLIEGVSLAGKKRIDYSDAEGVANTVTAMLNAGAVPPLPFSDYAALAGAATYRSRHTCVQLPIDAVLDALSKAKRRPA